MQAASSVYFGSIAENYESTRVTDPMWQREHDTIAPVLLRSVGRGDQIVDVAAGTGRWLDVYAAAGARCVLLDISSDMLQQAAARAANCRCEAEVLVADIFKLPELPTGDWLLSTRFFNWIPLRAIRSLLRRAGAGAIGRVAFTVRCIDSSASLRRRLESRWYWSKKNIDVLRGRRKKGWYYLQSDRRIRAVVRASGFRVIEQHVIERTRGELYTLVVASR